MKLKESSKKDLHHLFRKFVILISVGSADCAPCLVVASAPAAFAKRSACSIGMLEVMAVANAAMNASPAAVASIGVTLNDGVVNCVPS